MLYCTHATPMGFKMWPLGVTSDLDIVADLPLRQSAEMGEKP